MFPLAAFEMTLLILVLLVPAALAILAFAVGRSTYRRLARAAAVAMLTV